jgi:hypothetical protein
MLPWNLPLSNLTTAAPLTVDMTATIATADTRLTINFSAGLGDSRIAKTNVREQAKLVLGFSTRPYY